MTDKASKASVVDNLCEQLGLEDHAELGRLVTELYEVATSPSWGITIVWKPRVVNSHQINVFGVPTTPQAAQQVGDMLTAVAREFTNQALQMALQSQEEEEDGENRTRETDSLGDED